MKPEVMQHAVTPADLEWLEGCALARDRDAEFWAEEGDEEGAAEEMETAARIRRIIAALRSSVLVDVH